MSYQTNGSLEIDLTTGKVLITKEQSFQCTFCTVFMRNVLRRKMYCMSKQWTVL